MSNLFQSIKILVNQKPRLAVLIFFVILGLLVFGRVINYPFVHDDHVFIVSNPDISKLGDFSYWIKAMPQTDANFRNVYYRPLLEIIYRLEFRFFGGNPAGYHLVNIFLHIINAFLIFLVFKRLTGFDDIAFYSGALFLVHPVQTEAVACIAGISNLVFTLLFFLSLLMYLKSERAPIKDSGKLYFLSLFLFAAALFAKEQAIALPLIVLAITRMGTDVNLSKKISSFLKPAAGFFAVGLAYFFWRGLLLRGQMVPCLGEGGELWIRLMAAPREMLMFLRLLVWPADLHYYRNIDILAPNAAGFIGTGLTAIILLSIIARLKGEFRRWAFIGLFWFAITIAPVLIAPLVNEYSFVLAAEHFLYLSLAGALLCIFSIAKNAGQTLELTKIKIYCPGFSQFLILLLTVTAALLSWHQNRIWAGEVILFERTVKYEKQFGRGYLLLGKAYYFDGKYDEALNAFDKSLSVMKKYQVLTDGKPVQNIYTGFIKGIYFDKAHVEEAKGDFNGARENYRAALSIDPRDPEMFNSLGVTFAREGNCNEAVLYFRKALEINNKMPLAEQNLLMCERMLKTR